MASRSHGIDLEGGLASRTSPLGGGTTESTMRNRSVQLFTALRYGLDPQSANDGLFLAGDNKRTPLSAGKRQPRSHDVLQRNERAGPRLHKCQCWIGPPTPTPKCLFLQRTGRCNGVGAWKITRTLSPGNLFLAPRGRRFNAGEMRRCRRFSRQRHSVFPGETVTARSYK